jgi:hypothetical protein
MKKKINTNRVPIGSIFEIKVGDAFAYGQCVNYSEEYDHFVVIFQGIHKTKITDIALIKALPIQFSSFYPLWHSLRLKHVTIIGHAEVPPQYKEFGLFKDYHLNLNTNEKTWLILYIDNRKFSDKKHFQILGHVLPEEYFELPYHDIANTAAIIESIKTGWTVTTDITESPSLEYNINKMENVTSPLKQPEKKKSKSLKNESQIEYKNPLSDILMELLKKLEKISKSHEEIFDTEVRESMFLSVWNRFIAQKKNYTPTNQFHMFSNKGNSLVKIAINEFIDKAVEVSKTEKTLKTKKQRLFAFQDDRIETKSQLAIDDFFGYMENCPKDLK